MTEGKTAGTPINYAKKELTEGSPGRRGRPPKFGEPRRPVTVTLPDRILDRLAAVSEDRAAAIVKCVEAAAGGGEEAVKPVQLIKVMPGKALIAVGPSRLLRSISWLQLVEISPTRSLLVFPAGTPIERLEVDLVDLLHGMAPEAEADRELLETLRDSVGAWRRKRAFSKAELVFVDLSRASGVRPRRGASSAGGPKRAVASKR